MRFTETKLKGAFVVEPERLEDERGFFARTFCEKEFRARGLTMRVVQCNVSFNRRKGTLRGMHYQAAPYGEAKVVCCAKGAIHDVLIDLRRGSRTFGQWFGLRLSDADRRMLFVPKGFAHGFVTLEPNTEVTYLMSAAYRPGCARGLRWNDPAFGVKWPVRPAVISERDRTFPLFRRTVGAHRGISGRGLREEHPRMTRISSGNPRNKTQN